MDIPPQHAPVATPLPEPPSGQLVSETQWDTLLALLDGCMPAIASAAAGSADPDKLLLDPDRFRATLDSADRFLQGPPDRKALEAFLAHSPSRAADFKAACLRFLASTPHRDRLLRIMGLLGTNYGSLLLTGYWTPVAQQPTETREAIVSSWASSSFAALRMLAKAVTSMAQNANAVSSPYFQQLSGYTDVPRNWAAVDGYPFRFLQLDAGDAVHEMTTDVVVVGSGCGGAVSARNLAEAGHRVLVVEKGYHFPPSHLPMPQAAACSYLFDNGGALVSDDASINVLSGGALGGGGTVNWSVCFRTPHSVRDEWAAAGLPLFASADFDDCLDRVWESIGASTDGIRHNHRNRSMLDGCRKLAWLAAPVEQNTGDREHACGQCHLGCGSAEKRGPTVAWLPAAAEAGAQLMEGFQVDRVTFAADGVTATGVEGLWTSRGPGGDLGAPPTSRTQRRVRIKASRVILSAGSLWSPVILMKSGVENRNVGRNLHLHPCNLVSGAYKEDVRPWEGSIITTYSDEFADLDCKGHGVKLEPSCMVPYMALSMQTWLGGLDARMLALKYRHMDCFVALTRDRDSGRVYVDRRTGRPRIDYTISDFDRDHTLEGVQALAKICYVTGATEIRAGLPGLAPFVVEDGGERQRKHPEGRDPEFTDAAFGAWLARLRAADNKPPAAVFGSAHQMGSCRMSADESSGVVDGQGRVWGREGLYVADASVFPSASGVNPMVTAMALADWISRGVARELGGGGGGGGGRG
ncbi:hypothetical protein CDD83_7196 [Cordyceps sp. RAO-2017]|nr:hypothetical protein CDD83_7196 [Cordyceps sp. RAO-2017]